MQRAEAALSQGRRRRPTSPPTSCARSVTTTASWRYARASVLVSPRVDRRRAHHARDRQVEHGVGGVGVQQARASLAEARDRLSPRDGAGQVALPGARARGGDGAGALGARAPLRVTRAVRRLSTARVGLPALRFSRLRASGTVRLLVAGAETSKLVHERVRPKQPRVLSMPAPGPLEVVGQ